MQQLMKNMIPTLLGTFLVLSTVQHTSVEAATDTLPQTNSSERNKKYVWLLCVMAFFMLSYSSSAIAAESDSNWIYACGVSKESTRYEPYVGKYMYKIRPDGTGKQLIREMRDCGGRVLEQGDYLYFDSRTDQGYRLFRMKKDGTNLKRISNQSAYDFAVMGDRVYYNHQVGSSYDFSLHSVKLDGTKHIKYKGHQVYQFGVQDGWIYFTQGVGARQLYKMKTDGTQLTDFKIERADKMILSGNYIYYSTSLSNSFSMISRVHINGTDRRVLVKSKNLSIYFSVHEGWIYYYDWKDTKSDERVTTLKGMKTNGTMKKTIRQFKNINQGIYLNEKSPLVHLSENESYWLKQGNSERYVPTPPTYKLEQKDEQVLKAYKTLIEGAFSQKVNVTIDKHNYYFDDSAKLIVTANTPTKKMLATIEITFDDRVKPYFTKYVIRTEELTKRNLEDVKLLSAALAKEPLFEEFTPFLSDLAEYKRSEFVYFKRELTYFDVVLYRQVDWDGTKAGEITLYERQ